MVNQRATLDRVFGALADPTPRAILARPERGADASVSALKKTVSHFAATAEMSLS